MFDDKEDARGRRDKTVCRPGEFFVDQRAVSGDRYFGEYDKGQPSTVSEVDNREGNIKSEGTRNSRCGIGEPKARIDGLVGRGCDGKKENSTKSGKFLEEAGLWLFRSRIRGVRSGRRVGE